jgi:ABC-type lipoprotein release transport system permease subunit
MMAIRLAWRNIWRNSRRTAITLAAISLTAAILIASYSLMDGLMKQFRDNATNLLMGEVQIHQAKYLVNRSMYKDLPNPDQLVSNLKAKGLPASPRSYGYGLTASGTKSAGAMFVGIDPESEKQNFDLAKHMAEGDFLGHDPQMGLVLGRKLARSLNVTVGSEVVVVVQAADGSLGNDLYTVTGILKSVGDAIDRTAAIMHQKDFQTLFVSDGRIHEIAVNTRGQMPLEQATALTEQAAPNLEVKSWRDLSPTMSDMLNLFDAGIWIFGMIFYLAGGLGLMNTMLMATFERIREFGMLKAIGTTPWRILRDVTVEAFVLSVAASIIGLGIGLAGSYYLQVVGLDTSVFAPGSYTVAGIAFDPIWRAAISIKTVIYPVVVLWIVCLLASLYPAAIAARLDPVKAMSHV